MKHYIPFFFLSLMLAGNPAVAQTSAHPIAQLGVEAGGITSYQLSNDFKIILIPFPSASNTRVELLVKSGSKLEGYGETGMAHLLEHMLFKGAGNRKNIKDDLTMLGAVYNGTTTADRTNFFETVNSDPLKIDELIKIEADRFIRARFTENDLASEMTVVRNELENSERDPIRLVMSTLSRISFSWHGYSRPVIGARSDIEGATFNALKNFHSKHYRPDNAALIISGNFDKERVLSLASRLFSVAKNPLTDKPENLTFDNPQAATNRSELYLSAGTTMVASAWKLPSIKELDVYALDLAVAALCDPYWGSLRTDLVLQKKLAVSASCYTSPEADYSRFIAFANAGQNSNAEAISKALVKHIEDAAIRGVSQEQLERARLTELNSFQRALDAHEKIADLVSEFEVAGDWRLFLWAHDVVNSITLDEANQALRKWLVSTNRGDVLLSHSEAITPLDFPRPTDAKKRVLNTVWPSIFSSAAPPPKSLIELSQSTQIFELDGQRAKAALISRKTQGDKVWIFMENDYGNLSSLADRKTACYAASSLVKYGGNGLSRDELSSRMEKLQAIWQISLSGVALEVPRKNLEEAFTTLFYVWASPDLAVSEFDRYKATQLAMHESSLMNPVKVADNDTRMRFDNYPNGHWSKPQSFGALIEEINKLSYEEVQRCRNDFSNISHARIGIVGNIREDEIKALWKKTGLSKPSRISYERIPNPPAPVSVDVTPIKVVMPDTTNAKVTGTTVVAINRNSDDFPALQIAVDVIGGSSSSLIWKQLREIDGLAYSSGMYIVPSSFEDRSTIQLFATSSSGNVEKTLNRLKSILSRALEEGFTPDQIKKAKEIWAEKRKAFLGMERDFASTLTASLYDEYGFSEMAKFDEKISLVDHKQASNAIRKYLKPSSIVWATGQGK